MAKHKSVLGQNTFNTFEKCFAKTESVLKKQKVFSIDGAIC